jgi:hypothetical protein
MLLLLLLLLLQLLSPPVTENTPDLLARRRRWLNGSFFALIFYITKFSVLLGRSDHSLCRRFWLLVQFVYQCSLLVNTWIGVGSLYLTIVIIFNSALAQVSVAGEARRRRPRVHGTAAAFASHAHGQNRARSVCL